MQYNLWARKRKCLVLFSGFESHLQPKRTKYNRGKGDLTSDYVVGLWNKGCAYCGEKDFMKLGVDRIYNDKPHTKDFIYFLVFGPSE